MRTSTYTATSAATAPTLGIVIAGSADHNSGAVSSSTFLESGDSHWLLCGVAYALVGRASQLHPTMVRAIINIKDRIRIDVYLFMAYFWIILKNMR